MSTDHEDLAFAAKAAGKHRCEWDHAWLAARGDALARDMLWDPRRDSGQALELAAQLDIDIEFDRLAGPIANCGAGHFATSDITLSRIEATRMAVFDAAVAIGRAMP